MKKLIKIDIISDVVCPWCYVGEHRLQQALDKKQPEFAAAIHFYPFELNPDMPEEGVNHLEYLADKFGSKSRVHAVHHQLETLAQSEGLPLNFDLIQKSPNTFKAHRLIWLAAQYKVQRQVAVALYLAYFAEGKNVGDENELIHIGTIAGIPQEKLTAFFSGTEGEKEVHNMEKEIYQSGISSVPAFIIDDKYLVRGAQPVETFCEALEKAAADGLEINAVAGESCDENSCL